jgi:hypothetical protein
MRAALENKDGTVVTIDVEGIPAADLTHQGTTYALLTSASGLCRYTETTKTKPASKPLETPAAKPASSTKTKTG